MQEPSLGLPDTNICVLSHYTYLPLPLGSQAGISPQWRAGIVDNSVGILLEPAL